MPSHIKKKRLIVNHETIDEKHNQIIQQMNRDESEQIPFLERQKEEYKTRLHSYQHDQIDEIMDCKDKIKEIKQQIQEIKRRKTEYLLENSRYVFGYFEDKKKIANPMNSGQGEKTKQILNSFFKIQDKSVDSRYDPTQQRYNQSKQLYQKYWRNVNRNLIGGIQDYIITADACKVCRQGDLISQEEEGILICNNRNCGAFVAHIVDSERPTYKDPPNEPSYNPYDRSNHFKEILSQFQAKETTVIPQSVIEDIYNRIKKERITDMSEINYNKMREILKQLGYNRYFEHVQYINSIFGIKPPTMSEELQETLCILFIEIQEPWAIHCPMNRTNFFSCAYILYQLCVLLDQNQYLPYIPLMKDREKQLEQDLIWKKVCESLDWEFIPTV